MKLLTTLLLLCCLLTARSQPTAYQTLLAAEYVADTAATYNQAFLVAFRFSGGRYLSKDTLGFYPVSKDGLPGTYVSFDGGNHTIYQNRYIITGSGSVIDSRNGEVLTDMAATFIEASGDTLLFHRANRSGTGYRLLDLKAKDYRFINHKPIDRDNIWSPDKKHAVYIDYRKPPYPILLSTDGIRRKLVVHDAGPGMSPAGYFQSPVVRVHWTDNDHFLYTVHSMERNSAGSRIAAVSIRLYTLRTGDDIPVARIAPLGALEMPDLFYIGETGLLVYRTGDMRHFILDKTNFTPLQTSSFQLGYGFEASLRYPSAFSYQQEPIGVFDERGRVATDGALAIAYDPDRSTTGRASGYKIWTAATREWLTIDVPRLCSLIGWTTDSVPPSVRSHFKLE